MENESDFQFLFETWQAIPWSSQWLSGPRLKHPKRTQLCESQ